MNLRFSRRHHYLTPLSSSHMTEARFPTIFDDRVLLNFEERCYPNSTYTKVFRYRDEPPAFQISGFFEGIWPLVKELDAPTHHNAIYCVRLMSPAELLPRNSVLSKSPENYCVEKFGLRIEPFPQRNREGKIIAPVGKAYKFVIPPTYWSERSDYVIQVLRTRVFACPITSIRPSLAEPVSGRHWAMYLEESWHPTRGKRRSLHWAEPRNHIKSTVDQFKKDALRILDGAKRLGRPLGTKKFSSRDEFMLKYKEACLKVRRQGEVGLQPVADEMEISLSTLNRRLVEHDLKSPPNLV
jgi:hypothetical protein